MNVYSFWNDTLAQDAVKIRKYFHENAYINWHDTNEHFTLEEFIIANCEYPDKWNGKVEKVLEYWGEDDDVPQWRLDKHIGKPIK